MKILGKLQGLFALITCVAMGVILYFEIAIVQLRGETITMLDETISIQKETIGLKDEILDLRQQRLMAYERALQGCAAWQ